MYSYMNGTNFMQKFKLEQVRIPLMKEMREREKKASKIKNNVKLDLIELFYIFRFHG